MPPCSRNGVRGIRTFKAVHASLAGLSPLNRHTTLHARSPRSEAERKWVQVCPNLFTFPRRLCQTCQPLESIWARPKSQLR
jgi:hypothetical protein